MPEYESKIHLLKLYPLSSMSKGPPIKGHIPHFMCAYNTTV